MSSVCWGNGKDGALGVVNYGYSSRPIVVDFNAGEVKELSFKQRVAAGMLHTCAVKSDGTVYCWGAGGQGQLGINSTEDDRDQGVQVKGVGGSGYLGDIIQVTAGDHHTCAVKDNGAVFCWGKGENGRLGHNKTSGSKSKVPVRVVTSSDGVFNNVKQISAGGRHTCALKNSGEIFCWGHADRGQMATSSTGAPKNRISFDSSDDDNVQVSAGHEHTCAVKEDGSLWCWGESHSGKIGNGEFSEDDHIITNPHQVEAYTGRTLDGIVQVSAGEEHTCALHYTGVAYCWGLKDDGRLTASGEGPKLYPTLATKQSGQTLEGLIQVIAAHSHSCARTQESKALCWGKGSEGRLGNNTNADTPYPSGVKNPDNTAASLTNVFELSQPRDKHMCVVKGTSAQVLCWGEGQYGRLGNDSDNDKKIPGNTEYRSNSNNIFLNN